MCTLGRQRLAENPEGDSQKYESNKMPMPPPVMQKEEKMRQIWGISGGIKRIARGSNVHM